MTTHTHKWKYDRKAQEWRCTRRGCGEVVTVLEFVHTFGRLGNLDVVPLQGIEQIVARRKRNVHGDIRHPRAA